jgi:uncharacterized membrane protein YphA (DoxX/SURF4 family)
MTQSNTSKQYILITLRFVFGAILLSAAFSKILDSDKLARQIARYDIVAPTASAAIGTVLPWIEFTFGACLVSSLWKGGAWLGTVLLFTCFAVARGSVLWRRMSIDCGCGLLDGTITPVSELLVVSMLCTAIAAFIATLRSHPQVRSKPDATAIEGTSSPSRMPGNMGRPQCA